MCVYIYIYIYIILIYISCLLTVTKNHEHLPVQQFDSRLVTYVPR